MTDAHQDVAGLVDKADAWDAIAEKNAEIARLRQEMSAAIAFWKAAAKRFSDARKSAVRRIQSDADRLESLSQALREAEAKKTNGYEFLASVLGQRDLEIEHLKSRLAEAMEVIKPLVVALEADCIGEVCKDEDPNDPVGLSEDGPTALTFGMIYAARAFIAGNGGKDAHEA